MTLDELADQAVDAVLDEHRDELAALVASRVRRRLAELVRSLVGASDEAVEPAAVAPAAVELAGPDTPNNGHAPAPPCSTCRERTAITGRTICGTCKARRQRERAQETASASISARVELDADSTHVEREDRADGATGVAARIPPAPVERRPRRRTGGRLVSADQREATRERAELIASVEPEVERDGDGREWSVRRLPATYAPPAGPAPIAAD